MPQITSPHNAKLKEIRKLHARRRNRDHSHRFVAEGEDLLKAADDAGWEPLERFATAGSGLPGIEVDPKTMASLSGLASGTRTLAIYEERWASSPTGLCVYLHGVHDPGNVGTILRSVAAFNGSCVVLGPGSADPYSPKAVRASMGAIFTVPVARATAIDELPGTTVALVAGAGMPLHELEAGDATDLTLLIGAEREGLPQHIIERADQTAHIPIETNSLNAAMATTVALYEMTRMARAR